MGVLDWIFGKRPAPIVAQQPIRTHNPVPLIRCRAGAFPQEVVGERHYLATFERLFGDRDEAGVDLETLACLVREPNNPHDANAVRVEIQGQKIGYIPRDDAARLAPHLDRLKGERIHCLARVRGGWIDDEDEGDFGVRLAVPTSGPITLG